MERIPARREGGYRAQRPAARAGRIYLERRAQQVPRPHRTHGRQHRRDHDHAPRAPGSLHQPPNDSTKWQARKPDPELEAVMLQRLALRFGPAHALRVAVAPEVAPAAPAVVPAAGAALSAPVAPTTAA